ncbi:unnamed protein product, partial [Trichogramma brassicae]
SPMASEPRLNTMPTRRRERYIYLRVHTRCTRMTRLGRPDERQAHKLHSLLICSAIRANEPTRLLLRLGTCARRIQRSFFSSKASVYLSRALRVPSIIDRIDIRRCHIYVLRTSDETHEIELDDIKIEFECKDEKLSMNSLTNPVLSEKPRHACAIVAPRCESIWTRSWNPMVLAPSIRDSNAAQRLCKLYNDCTAARNGRGKKSKIITTCLWWTICSRVDNCKCCLACDSFCETGTRRGTKEPLLSILPAASIAIGSIEEIFVGSRPGQRGRRCSMRTAYVATRGFSAFGRVVSRSRLHTIAKSILHFSILCAAGCFGCTAGTRKSSSGLNHLFASTPHNTSPSIFVLPKKRCLLPIELAMFANATLLRRRTPNMHIFHEKPVLINRQESCVKFILHPPCDSEVKKKEEVMVNENRPRAVSRTLSAPASAASTSKVKSSSCRARAAKVKNRRLHGVACTRETESPRTEKQRERERERSLVVAAIKDLKITLHKERNQGIQEYLEGLTATENTQYSLWKATNKIKRPIVNDSPIRKDDGTWARTTVDKLQVFEKYFTNVFTPVSRIISAEEESEILNLHTNENGDDNYMVQRSE